MLGAAWSLTNRLFDDSGVIKSQGNIWYLAVWAGVFALNHTVVLITGRTPTITIFLLLAGTGLVVGNVGGLLARYYRVHNV